MLFSLFPTISPCAFPSVFSTCFFHCFPFSFLFNFSKAPSHCRLLIPCSAEKYLQQQSFFVVSDKRCCWFSATRTCDTMRAVGGFTAHVKIQVGLSFLVNLCKWLGLILYIKRSQVWHKFFAGLEEFLPNYSSAFFAYNYYKLFPAMKSKVAINDDWFLWRNILEGLEHI